MFAEQGGLAGSATDSHDDSFRRRRSIPALPAVGFGCVAMSRAVPSAIAQHAPENAKVITARSSAFTTATATACASCWARWPLPRSPACLCGDRRHARMAAPADRQRARRLWHLCEPSSAAARIASSTTAARDPVAGRCGWTTARRRPSIQRRPDRPATRPGAGTSASPQR